MTVEERLAKLEGNLELVYGLANGLHAALLTLAREMPPAIATHAAARLDKSIERVHADMLASPAPDRSILRSLALLQEVQGVLRAAATSPPP